MNPGRHPSKVLIVGWPGVGCNLSIPLIESGKLPNLARLIEDGVIGRFTTNSLDTSLAYWSTIATGKQLYKHQHIGANEPCPNGLGSRPMSSLSRSCLALWNILNKRSKVSQVIGWPGSHPLEPVQGISVSEFFPKWISCSDDPRAWPLIQGSVHPKERASELAPLRMHPGEITGPDLLPLVPKLAQLNEARDPRLKRLAFHLAETVSLHTVATHVMENEPWDLHAIVYPGIDSISQLFANYHPPRLPFISKADFEMFQHVVAGMYTFHDQMLGRLLQLAGDDALVLVVSPFGHHLGKQRQPEVEGDGSKPIEVKDPGLFVMSGSGLKLDNMAIGTSYLDFMPTLLHAMGLPVGRDMDGRVREDFFETPQEIQYIDSWETENGTDGCHPTSERFSPVRMNFAPPAEGENIGITIARNAWLDLRYSLAECYINMKREANAIAILEDCWEKDPGESRYAYKLLMSHLGLNQPRQAREHFERMLKEKKQLAPKALVEWKALDARDPDTLTPLEKIRKQRLWKQSRMNISGMAFLQAWLLRGEGKYGKALAAAKSADEHKVYNRLGLLKLMADCHIKLKQYPQAEEIYQRVIEQDPEDSEPYLGLAQIYFLKRDYYTSASHALTSINLRYFNPIAHYFYGASLYRCWQPSEAVEALKITVVQEPLLVGAWRRLQLIHQYTLKDQELANFYNKKWIEAKAKLEQQRQTRHTLDDKLLTADASGDSEPDEQYQSRGELE